jgi:hypothetical protein
MNVRIACGLLNVKEDELSDMEIIKRKYRIKALMYHPDKNRSDDACDRFREIREAYEFLSNNADLESKSYKDLLSDFLKSNNTESDLFNVILNKIAQTCEDKTLRFLRTVDNKILINLFKLLTLYADVLHISADFLNEVKSMIKQDECIVLNPKLADIMSDNLYKLVVDGKQYLIPLWHNKLIYDNSGSDLYVVCSPILPDNVSIGIDNDITVSLKYKISELFGKKEQGFSVGDTEFKFNITHLRLAQHNKIILYNVGLSRVNMVDIYDVSVRGNIIANIELEQ